MLCELSIIVIIKWFVSYPFIVANVDYKVHVFNRIKERTLTYCFKYLLPQNF